MPKSKQKFRPAGYTPDSKYTADVWNSSYTIDQLQSYRRKMAKVANQRMVRLERGVTDTGSPLTERNPTYDMAMEYLRAHATASGTRFNERKNILTDANELRQEITVLENFLNAKKSTRTGYMQVEKRQTEYMAELLKRPVTDYAKMSPEERTRLRNFRQYLNNETYRAIAQRWDSESVQEMYRVGIEAGMDEKKVKDLFEEFRKSTEKIDTKTFREKYQARVHEEQLKKAGRFRGRRNEGRFDNKSGRRL